LCELVDGSAKELTVRAFAGFLALSALASVASGQNRSVAPDEVVRRFFQTEVDGRWADAAHFLDLNAFEGIRKASVDNARHRQPMRTLTVDQIMQFDPNMPREVAEYQVKEANKDRTFDFLEREYARVNSVDELASLSVEEAAARWLEAKDVRWQIGLAMKYSRSRGRHVPKCPAPDSAATLMAKDMTQTPAKILGVAREKSDSLAYVLVRDQWRPRAVSGLDNRAPILEISPSIVTLVRTGMGWKVYPAFDLPSPAGVRHMSVSVSCDSSESPKK
jgi:hypothetical protein